MGHLLIDICRLYFIEPIKTLTQSAAVPYIKAGSAHNHSIGCVTAKALTRNRIATVSALVRPVLRISPYRR
jgi:hypothetical protein